jgi:hypothetical protein
LEKRAFAGRTSKSIASQRETPPHYGQFASGGKHIRLGNTCFESTAKTPASFSVTPAFELRRAGGFQEFLLKGCEAGSKNLARARSDIGCKGGFLRFLRALFR